MKTMIKKAMEYREDNKGNVEGFRGATTYAPEEWLFLGVDVAVSAKIEDFMTTHNTDTIHAKMIVEGADSIPNNRGILAGANAGGVPVSYVDRVQNRSGYARTSTRVSRRSDRMMRKAEKNVCSCVYCRLPHADRQSDENIQKRRRIRID